MIAGTRWGVYNVSIMIAGTRWGVYGTIIGIACGAILLAVIVAIVYKYKQHKSKSVLPQFS
jgi:predicted PurR-regulated permease PerM